MRVTNMRGIDLSRWRFDWDLTFAMVVAHPDGTILHRYGGRDWRGADHWLTDPSLAAFLRAGLRAHGSHKAIPKPAKAPDPLVMEAIPAYAKRDKGECIHCHSVNPALRIEAQESGAWTLDDLWTYPSPMQVGFDLERDEQDRVLGVEPGSPAARAGLRAGDRIRRLGGTAIATASDVMAALDAADPDATELEIELQRESGELHQVVLALDKGWKASTPREFAWRPSKWGLSPAPGFGGPVLGDKGLRELGLPAGTFAFRVNYIVTWGENQRWGKAAARAGVREGMIVLGTEAKRDFESIDHFHAWWRLRVRPKSTQTLVVWKNGSEATIPVPIGK